MLRQTSARLRDGIAPDPDSPEVARFARAAEALAGERRSPQSDPVVPIDRLFYSDGGPHVVQRAVAPPTTRLQRFQEEITTRAEHIRRLVGDARRAQDAGEPRPRVARTLRDALTRAADDRRVVRRASGGLVLRRGGARGRPARPTLLEAVDAGAMLLLTPGGSMDEIERRLAVLERARRVTPIMTPAIDEEVQPTPSRPATPAVSPAIGGMATPVDGPASAGEPELLDLDEDEGPFSPVSAPTPRSAPAEPSSTQEILAALDLTPGSRRGPPAAAASAPHAPARQPSPARPGTRRPPATPSGRELQTLLEEGISGLGMLDDEPLSAPARLDEDDIVPIESLVYRGQSAIRRAITVRDEMRASGRTDDATLQEIFDLLDLAQAE